mmetsp:Transcript_4984/g.7119  ORF Transcript_4984/g.7119 Transcript_4984/m.7119 type:complete len:125 (-) Transcript_4984:59-433(-)
MIFVQRDLTGRRKRISSKIGTNRNPPKSYFVVDLDSNTRSFISNVACKRIEGQQKTRKSKLVSSFNTMKNRLSYVLTDCCGGKDAAPFIYTQHCPNSIADTSSSSGIGGRPVVDTKTIGSNLIV